MSSLAAIRAHLAQILGQKGSIYWSELALFMRGQSSLAALIAILPSNAIEWHNKLILALLKGETQKKNTIKLAKADRVRLMHLRPSRNQSLGSASPIKTEEKELLPTAEFTKALNWAVGVYISNILSDMLQLPSNNATQTQLQSPQIAQYTSDRHEPFNETMFSKPAYSLLFKPANYAQNQGNLSAVSEPETVANLSVERVADEMKRSYTLGVVDISKSKRRKTSSGLGKPVSRENVTLTLQDEYERIGAEFGAEDVKPSGTEIVRINRLL